MRHPLIALGSALLIAATVQPAAAQQAGFAEVPFAGKVGAYLSFAIEPRIQWMAGEETIATITTEVFARLEDRSGGQIRLQGPAFETGLEVIDLMATGRAAMASDTPVAAVPEPAPEPPEPSSAGRVEDALEPAVTRSPGPNPATDPRIEAEWKPRWVPFPAQVAKNFGNKAVEEACGGQPGRMDPRGLIFDRDLNGDGRDDLIVLHEWIKCGAPPTGRAMTCGIRVCSIEFFLNGFEGYEVLEGRLGLFAGIDTSASPVIVEAYGHNMQKGRLQYRNGEMENVP